MTTFQLLSLVLFGAVVLGAYGKDIFAKVRAAAAAVPRPAKVVPGPIGPITTAHPVVDDLVLVANLRDRLDGDKCVDGVTACSNLLKILVDHKHPHAG